MGVPGSNRYRVQVRFDLENTAFMKGMRKVNNELDNTQKQIRENYGALSDTLTRMNRHILMMLGGIAAGFTAIAVPAIKMSGEFERLGVTFEVLAGSAEKAKKLIEDIKTFAIRTPLQVKDIQEAATMMLGFGYAIDDIIPKLNMFGEASAALRVPLEQIIRVREFLAAGQFRTIMLAPLGITRQEMEQFGAVFGTRGELISGAEETVAAFDELLTTRFQGLFDKVFGTITGRISNIIDQIQLTFAEIGDALKPIVVEVMDWLEENFSRLREWLEANQATVTAAFNELLSVVKPIFAAMAEAVERFMAALKKDPGLIVRLAQNINNVVKALVAMLIINTVIIGIIKFSTAISFLNTALAMLHLTWAGIGAFLIGPWGIAIAAVIAGIVVLNILTDKQSEATKRHVVELENQKGAIKDNITEIDTYRKDVAELIGDLDNLEGQTDDTGESFRKIHENIRFLIRQNPDFLKLLGLTEDSTNNLYNANGNLITSIEDLESASNDFTLSNLRNELSTSRTEAQALRDTLLELEFQQMLVADPRYQAAGVSPSGIWGLAGYGMSKQEVEAIIRVEFMEMARLRGIEEMFGDYDRGDPRRFLVGPEAPEVIEEEEERRGGAAAAAAEEIDRFTELLRAYTSALDTATEQLQVEIITREEWSKSNADSLRTFIDGLIDMKTEIGLIPSEQELLNSLVAEYNVVIRELEKPLRDIVALEAERAERLEAILRAEKVKAASERERSRREAEEEMAKREAEKRGELKTEELEERIAESVREVYRAWREKLMKGATLLTEGILTGDISQALNYGFNLLTEHLTTRITAMLAQVGMATLGGPIGAVIGWGLSMLMPGPKGSTPSVPIYAHIVNFPEDRLGAYLPFSFLFSGRSNIYDVDYRGASLDRMRAGRRLGFHYGK